MIAILSKSISENDKDLVKSFLRERGFQVREQFLGEDPVIGALGKHTQDDLQELSLLPGVERVAATSKPYELASRETKNEDTIVSVGGCLIPAQADGLSLSQLVSDGEHPVVKIGGSRISVIAGPCAVESREQILETAQLVRESGAVILRGGAYKPRTSPYAFQGLGMKGLEYMREAGEKWGMPIVTEVVSPELALEMRDLVNMFQIGARNMQNFELLKKVGSLGKPVLLKRGPSATIEEWLLSAEYLLASGTRDVVLCERGIRTFETYTRNTLDISAIAVIKRLSHLPIIVDPSHATGIRNMVSSAALAAIAAGADGVTVEVHPRPDKALSDGPQSLYPSQFEKLMRDIQAMAPVVGKELLRTPLPRIPLKAEGDRRGISLQSSTPASGSGGSDAANSDAASINAVGIDAVGTDAADIDAAERIAYSGESGAYAEQALMRGFGEDAPRLPCDSFAAVFDAVLDGRASYGVVPVENSQTGSIHENYDLFLRYPDVAMVGELKLRIVHCLIADPAATMESIKVVRSHSQGFLQCKDFLDKHDWKLEPYYNTAAAVSSIVREAPEERVSVAAIAGEAAAKANGLKVLREGIETNPLNYTRFVIIARKPHDGEARRPPSFGSEKPNKASMVFSTADKPGCLFSCIKVLSDRGINLSKLESRPIQGKPWRYLFYVDVELDHGDETGKEISSAMEELKANSEDFRYFGSYRAAL